jgi:hypothetical protein
MEYNLSREILSLTDEWGRLALAFDTLKRSITIGASAPVVNTCIRNVEKAMTIVAALEVNRG